MSVDPSTEWQNDGELASVQNAVGPDEEITSIDSFTTEIKTLIDGTNHLHQHDYVVGEVTDYGVSRGDDAHFKLVHRKGSRENEKDDRLHCIIFENRRADITASIRDGQRVAVAGDISFYPPENRCSIKVEEVIPVDGGDSSHPFEIIRGDRRVQIMIATLLLLAALAVVYLLVV